MNHTENTYILICKPLKVAAFVGQKPFSSIDEAESHFRDGLQRFLLISERHGYEQTSTNSEMELKEYTLINS